MDIRGEVIHGEFNSADARVAAAVKLYDGDGAVDDGERILAGSVGDNGGIAMSFVTTPRYCKRGITPKVKSDTAGQVDVILTGFILTN